MLPGSQKTDGKITCQATLCVALKQPKLLSDFLHWSDLRLSCFIFFDRLSMGGQRLLPGDWKLLLKLPLAGTAWASLLVRLPCWEQRSLAERPHQVSGIKTEASPLTTVLAGTLQRWVTETSLN